MAKLSLLEYIGISHGLGAVQLAKRMRRIQESKLRVPIAKDWIEKEEEDQVTRMTNYFNDTLPTETIDGTPE